MLEDTIGGTVKRWSFRTADPLLGFTAVGYVSDAGRRGLAKGDLVEVINPFVPAFFLCQVASVTGGAGTLRLAAGSANAPPGQLLRTWVPDGHTQNATTATAFSFSSQWSLETDFDLVRLIYHSPVATGYTVVAASISPSSAVGDGTSSYNAAGVIDFTTWQPVYFNNAGANVSPQLQTVYGSGTASLTIPGDAGSLAQPPCYFSDWMRIASLPRVDGGIYPILLCRTLADSSGTFRSGGLSNWPPFNGLSSGRTLNAWIAGGVDHVTTPAAFGGSQNGILTPIGVQYLGRSEGFTVLGVGDSLTSGLGSSSGEHGWGYLASLGLSTPAKPISFWNQGWPSQVSSDFWANGYTAFQACKPDVVTIPVYTPNDGLTQATADTGFSRAMDLADFARRNGAVPVLMGPVPWPITLAQDVARLTTRTRMLQAAQSAGIYALDWEALLGTGASPNRLQTIYNSISQPNHPNDLGNSVMDTQVFRPVLRSILNL